MQHRIVEQGQGSPKVLALATLFVGAALLPLAIALAFDVLLAMERVAGASFGIISAGTSRRDARCSRSLAQSPSPSRQLQFLWGFGTGVRYGGARRPPRFQDDHDASAIGLHGRFHDETKGRTWRRVTGVG